MNTVKYKFRALKKREYKVIAWHPFSTAAMIAQAIIEKENIKRGRLCLYEESQWEKYNATDLIPKNTTLIVIRIPK